MASCPTRGAAVVDKQIYMSLGFPEIQDISGRCSIADIYPPKSTGVYLLQFPDNTYYIGKSIDVVRRFSQHRKSQEAISGISFMPVRQVKLNDIKQSCISALEQKCRLKNIALVSSPVQNSDFDAVLSASEQKHWLESPVIPSSCERVSDDVLRSKYTKKFMRLIQDHTFKEQILPVMQKYVQYCIPEPCKTEISFWGCSCLPASRFSSVKIYSRINIHWQEVFTVGAEEDGAIFFSFHTTRSIFENSRRKLTQLLKKYPTLTLHDHAYLSGGQDQWNPQLWTFDEALAILHEPLFLAAIKDFNLRNMRKGPEMFSRCHCMDLADLLVHPS